MCAIVQLCIVEESFSMHHLYFSIAVHLGRSFRGGDDDNLKLLSQSRQGLVWIVGPENSFRVQNAKPTWNHKKP